MNAKTMTTVANVAIRTVMFLLLLAVASGAPEDLLKGPLSGNPTAVLLGFAVYIAAVPVWLWWYEMFSGPIVVAGSLILAGDLILTWFANF